MKPKYVSPYYDYVKKIHYVESYYHPRTACGLEKVGLKTAPPNEAYSVTCPNCRAYLKSRNSNDEQSVEKTQSESKIPSRETKPKQYALYVVHEWNYYWGLYENGKLIGQDNGWNDLYEFLESNNISWKDVGKTIVLRPSQMKAVNYFPQSLRTLQKKLTVESKSLSPIVAKLIREADEEESEESRAYRTFGEVMESWYRLPKSRVKKLPDEATYWDTSGPVTVWIHGRGKQPGTVIAGSRDGSEVKDVPETMIKRKFSKGDLYGASGDYNPRDEMVGTARVRRESFLRRLTKILRETSDPDAMCPKCGTERFEHPTHMGWARCSNCGFEFVDDTPEPPKTISKPMNEAEGEPEEPPPQEDGEDSLDAQVDKYLSSYESESKSVKKEGFDYGPVARRFLFEEDEEGGGDEEVDIDTEEGGSEEPKKLTAEDLDVETFASSVMRLIDNYDTLLEVEHTLLRRASNFLSKNYEPEVVETFKETMRETHGLDVEKTKSETEDEIETPKAAEAGPAGGGGGGGMG